MHSNKKFFIFFALGLFIISAMSALQFSPLGQRSDVVGKHEWKNIISVELDSGQLPKEYRYGAYKGIFWPASFCLPQAIAYLLNIFWYCYYKSRVSPHITDLENIFAPHLKYFFVTCLIFVFVCLGTAIFFRKPSHHFIYGIIPAFYSTLFAAIMNFYICINKWHYFKSKMNIAAKCGNDVIKYFCDQMISVVRLVNRSTIILSVSIALGTWSILDKVYDNIEPALKFWHTLEIIIAFLVCIAGIVFLLLLPVIEIYFSSNNIYYDNIRNIGNNNPHSKTKPNQIISDQK